LSVEQSDGQESRARCLKNGVPQGSILAPCLFNIYISDIPTTLSTKLAYADGLALAFTGPDWANVENAMNKDLSTLHIYYYQNRLELSKEKAVYPLYHLNTRDVGRRLHISVDGKTIEFDPNPTYLGVTLDRSLTFKPHLTSVRQKVLSRCSLLNRLAGTGWSASVSTLRTSSLALVYPTAEYCSPAWSRSRSTKEVDVAINSALRTIPGCLTQHRRNTCQSLQALPQPQSDTMLLPSDSP